MRLGWSDRSDKSQRNVIKFRLTAAALSDYDPTRPLHDPSTYSTYAQPPYVTHLHFPSAVTGQSQESEHLHYVTSSPYPAPSSYEDNRSSIIDLRTRQLPEITSSSALRGVQGSRVYVYLQSIYDLLAPPAPSFALLFASRRCECLLEPLEHGSYFQYALSADVPSFISTGWHSFQVPLRMVMDGEGGQGPQAVEVGAFAYTEQATQSPQQDMSRKRKISTSSEEAVQRPAKRPSNQRLRIKENAEAFVYNTAATSPYSPFLPTPTSASVYQPRYQQAPSPRPMMHEYSASNASQPSIKVPSPHTPSWSPSFATVNKASRSPRLPVAPAGRPSTAASPARSANPPLIRTSTLQQSPGAVSPAVVSSHTGQTFNPYAMYPHKAVLKLNGELDAMGEGWSLEEWDAKRRLVEFTRRQTGSAIHADFKPVAPEDRQPSSICISCIWWEEKKECYVTSVDTIYLLESLVAVRFTVEEKNRIRRNLEGFRPLTVSKAKADSEEFFKIIMGFPNPKPRNIEKDVKVFPWKILAHALKKIIGKYVSTVAITICLQVTNLVKVR